MIRPSPTEVLRALDEVYPSGASIALSRDCSGLPSSLRRVAMAVSAALGHSGRKTAQAFQRDHTTVVATVAVYCGRQVRGHKRAAEEANLFRRLIVAAHAEAQKRANVVPFKRRIAA